MLLISTAQPIPITATTAERRGISLICLVNTSRTLCSKLIWRNLSIIKVQFNSISHVGQLSSSVMPSGVERHISECFLARVLTQFVSFWCKQIYWYWLSLFPFHFTRSHFQSKQVWYKLHFFPYAAVHTLHTFMKRVTAKESCKTIPYFINMETLSQKRSKYTDDVMHKTMPLHLLYQHHVWCTHRWDTAHNNAAGYFKVYHNLLHIGRHGCFETPFMYTAGIFKHNNRGVNKLKK